MATQATLPLVNNKIRDKGFARPHLMPGAFSEKCRTVIKEDGSTKVIDHLGWDLDAKVNTPVYALAKGPVIQVGNLGSKGWGLFVLLEFDNPKYDPNGKQCVGITSFEKLYALYAHLSKCTVAPPGPVEAGDEIGRTGNSGNAKGEPPHLHIEILVGSDLGLGKTKRIDPGEVFGYEIYTCAETGIVNQSLYGSCKQP